MTSEVIKLFETISAAAMDRGLDLQLEQKEYFHDAKGIGPSIGGGHTEDTGVVLRVYQPEKDNEQEQETTDGVQKSE
ncbi:MAG: hypothetical protein IKG01_12335 [Lachnospiraceae bacterium]|nr:hypothetical protein [Lachnospiraceae bacterium]